MTPRERANQPTGRRYAAARDICLLLVLSIAVYKVLLQIHAVNFEYLASLAQDVLHGNAYWRAYQNRLLAPGAVYLISLAGISYAAAYKIFILLSVTAQNLLFFGLLRRLGVVPGRALTWTAIYSLLFVLVQDQWFYPWDLVDALVFTLFAYGVFTAQPLSFFLCLFGVEIFNRESALFIALYIIIDAFDFASITRFRLQSRLKLVVGSLLLAGGMIYTKLIRDALFVINPRGMLDSSHALLGNHITFFHNIKMILFSNLFTTDIVNSAFILGTVCYWLFFILDYTDTGIKALLIYLAMTVNIAIFGDINETRMYIILLPFILFLIAVPERLTAEHIRTP
jgi:hypothetical protein